MHGGLIIGARHLKGLEAFALISIVIDSSFDERSEGLSDWRADKGADGTANDLPKGIGVMRADAEGHAGRHVDASIGVVDNHGWALRVRFSHHKVKERLPSHPVQAVFQAVNVILVLLVGAIKSENDSDFPAEVVILGINVLDLLVTAVIRLAIEELVIEQGIGVRVEELAV